MSISITRCFYPKKAGASIITVHTPALIRRLTEDDAGMADGFGDELRAVVGPEAPRNATQNELVGQRVDTSGQAQLLERTDNGFREVYPRGELHKINRIAQD
jgi:hypothetical protein